ncbi:hypothetical protein T484DRAFT_1840424, partial [Baffinella frigidus]
MADSPRRARKHAAFAAALLLSAALLAFALLGGDQEEGRGTALAEELALTGPGPLSDQEMKDEAAAGVSLPVRVRRTAGSSTIEHVEVPRGASLQERDGSWFIKMPARGSDRKQRVAGKKSASERLLAKFLRAQLMGSAHARQDRSDALRPRHAREGVVEAACDLACRLLKVVDKDERERHRAHVAPRHKTQNACGVKCVVNQLADIIFSSAKPAPSHSALVRESAALPPSTLRLDRTPEGGISSVLVPPGSVVKETSDGWEVRLAEGRADAARDEAGEGDVAGNADAAKDESGEGDAADTGDAGRAGYKGAPLHSPVDVYEPTEDPYYCIDGTNNWECGGEKAAA